MKSTISLMMLAAILCAGCGGSGNDVSSDELSDYVALQSAWDTYSAADQMSVCFGIEDDPSIVRSTAIDGGINPDVSEQFFSDVCP